MPSSFANRSAAMVFCLAGLTGLSLAPVVSAQETENAVEARQQFDVPAGPLSSALNQLASQAGLALTYEASLAEGKTTDGVQGRYSAAEALQRLLAGTGLGYRFTGNDTVTLESSDQDGSIRMAPVTVQTSEMSAFDPVDGYAASHAFSATRMSTPILETPASIQVVPREVIDDQGARGLEDVYTNVSGVNEAGNTLNAQAEVRPIIRGFESQLLFRNGMRATNVGAVDLVNVESVEVLKGPASILFGAVEPGGVLNYNTKRPQAEEAREISQEVGSYDHYRTTLDFTGPMNDEKTALYRFNAAYTDSGSFRDSVQQDNVALAPSFSFSRGGTDMLVDLSYTRKEETFDNGVPFSDDDEPLVSEDTFFGDDDLDGQVLEDYFGSWQLEHRINGIFTLRNQFQFHRVDAHNETVRHRGVSGSPGSEQLGRRYQNLDALEDEYQLVTDLVADFSTGEVKHELLMGVDMVYQDQNNERFRQNLSAIAISDDPQTDVNPPANQPMEESEFENRWLALYLQDQMSLMQDRLHLLAGGRYDDFESKLEEDGVPSPDVDESKFTGRFGALYDLTYWMSPFISASQSFNPQGAFAVNRDGDLIAPEEGRQYEVGFKFVSSDERLVANLAAYRLEKENVAVFDRPHFINTGEVAFTTTDQRSEGVELDITGQLTEQWKVIANYANTDTEVLENRADPSMEGEPLGNVPEESVRLWATYDFASLSALHGFGVGAGLRYQSDRKAQFDDTELDSFTTFDAGAWYTHPLDGGKALKAQLNVENLTDEEYYPRASDQSIVHPGEPLTVTGRISLEF